MKQLLTFLTFFNVLFCFAQKDNTDIQVEYQAFFDTEMPMKMYTTLYISGNVAVYQEKYTTKESWAEKVKPDNNPPGTTTTTSGGIPEDNYYKIDRNKKEISFFDNIMRNKFLVKDSYPDLEWKIDGETKTVAGLSCIKASTNFRGREWIVWFAPEIPLAFGPWKLQGLPGLILEAHDSTNRYTMKAVKVEYKKSDVVAKDFAKFFETKNRKPITYQKFLDDQKEATDNFHAEMEQKMKAMGATVTTNPAPRSGFELQFEWEP